MLALNESNAAAYLSERSPSFRVTAPPRALGGGVSNTVLLVETASGPLVLKQALEKLRVEEEWRSDPARTIVECQALEFVAGFLNPGDVPAIRFRDDANLIYAMDAAPGTAVDWKTLLLAGDVQPETAARVGAILGTQIASTWNSSECRQLFHDQRIFDELRLDPYYRFAARRHPDLGSYFEGLIERCRYHATSLVHGDWSPKNFLIHEGRPIAIDYEVAHYGDPSFDSAFLLNHLLLKTIHRPDLKDMLSLCGRKFWLALEERLPPEASWFGEGTQAHLCGLLLARVDGKSPAAYLSSQEQALVRTLALDLIARRPSHVLDVWNRLKEL